MFFEIQILFTPDLLNIKSEKIFRAVTQLIRISPG
jgi:hypothetical protein